MTREEDADAGKGSWIEAVFKKHLRDNFVQPYVRGRPTCNISQLQGFVVRAEDRGPYQVLWTCPEGAPEELVPVIVFDLLDLNAVQGNSIKAFGYFRDDWTPDYRVKQTFTRAYNVYKMQIY